LCYGYQKEVDGARFCGTEAVLESCPRQPRIWRQSMKVGDLVRHRESGDCGIVVEDQDDDDGIYLVVFTDGLEDYCDNEDVEVLNESG
tara:strand:+ start:248 stop:511 length:264 start_codon:yes stop_codon:yes gene_type:complete